MSESTRPKCWCGALATTSYLKRVGEVPEGGHDDRRKPDKSGLYVVRTCSGHAPAPPTQLPGGILSGAPRVA